MTTNRAGLLTKRLITKSQHLPARVTNAEKFVKSKDYSRIGKNFPGQAEKINTISVKMMKMDDVGLNGSKKFGIDLMVTRR